MVTNDFFGYSPARPGAWMDKLSFHPARYNRILVPLIFLFTPVLLYYAGDVTFNSDMNRLNFMSPAMKRAEKVFNRINQRSLRSIYNCSRWYESRGCPPSHRGGRTHPGRSQNGAALPQNMRRFLRSSFQIHSSGNGSYVGMIIGLRRKKQTLISTLKAEGFNTEIRSSGVCQL